MATIKSGIDKKNAKKSFKGGGFSKEGLASAIDMSADFVTGIQNQMFEGMKSKINSKIDDRDNPYDTMKKTGTIDILKNLNEGGAKGAKIGTKVSPGMGTAIGAASGILISGIKEIFNKDEKEKARLAATEEWSNRWSSKTAESMARTGYKEGGLINGPGTEKSDSIKATVENGSFITPAENADYAMDLGRSYLGWNDDNIAKRNQGGNKVNLSDGEVLFTPQEVAVLRYHGINFDELAPNADADKKMGTGGFANEEPDEPGKGTRESYESVEETEVPWSVDETSGLVFSKSKGLAYDENGSEYKLNDGNYEPTGKQSAYGATVHSDVVSKAEVDPEDPKKSVNPDKKNVLDFAPELLGALQSAAGAYGLMQAGKVPDLTVSHTLNKLSSEIRRLAEFGYEPKVLNALINEIDSSRNILSRAITEGGANSGLETMAKLNSLLSTTIDKKAGLAFSDAAEKARKVAEVMKIDSIKAGQEFDINKFNIESYYKNQEAFAGLMNAGIQNIIGARKLKSEQDTLRQIGNSEVTFKKQ